MVEVGIRARARASPRARARARDRGRGRGRVRGRLLGPPHPLVCVEVLTDGAALATFASARLVPGEGVKRGKGVRQGKGV